MRVLGDDTSTDDGGAEMEEPSYSRLNVEHGRRRARSRRGRGGGPLPAAATGDCSSAHRNIGIWRPTDLNRYEQRYDDRGKEQKPTADGRGVEGGGWLQARG